MNIADFSVKRPVAVLVLVIIVLILGTISFSRLNIDLFPKINFPMITVVTLYPGVAPQEIENTLTKPLEEGIGTVSDIKSITSYSREGVSQISIEFEYGTDLDAAAAKLREKIDVVKSTFPADVKSPTLSRVDVSMTPVLTLALSGPQSLSYLRTLADEGVKKPLQTINGVASVTVSGGYEREIQVQLDPYKLAAYELTVPQVMAKLKLENLNIPGGRLTVGNTEYLVRLVGEFEDLEDIESVVLVTPKNGFPVRVRDVAKVLDTHKEVRSITRSNQQPAVFISIQKNSDANTVLVAEAAKRTAESLKATLPAGNSLIIVFDESDYITRTIDQVSEDARTGAILAIFIIFFFLGNIRSTFVIGLSIPISVVATFVLLYFSNMTINVITLLGLMLGIGRIVDDSIVVLENIYRHFEQGESLRQAAVEGTREVGTAVLASTLTTVSVFAPLIFVQGLMREFFKPMALTVSFALFASLGVALTLVPMLASRLIKPEKEDTVKFKPIQVWLEFFKKLEEFYRGVLTWSLRHKTAVLSIAVSALLLSLVLAAFVGFEFMPQHDEANFMINIEAPIGSDLAYTDGVARKVEALVRKIPELDKFSTLVGMVQRGGRLTGGSTDATNLAEVDVYLVKKNKRQRTVFDIIDDMRKQAGDIAGAKFFIAPPTTGGGSKPLDLIIKGEDLATLNHLAQTIMGKLARIEGIRDIDVNWRAGNPEIHIVMKREKAALYGFEIGQLAETLRTSFLGQAATQYRGTGGTTGKEVDLTLIFPKYYRNRISDLQGLTLVHPKDSGKRIPLAEIAEITYSSGPTQIARKDQEHEVEVTGEIQDRSLSDIMREVKRSLATIEFPIGYHLEYGGQQKQMMESFSSLGMVFILAIFLVFLLMAFQFESFLQPLIIMFAIPLEFIGVTAALLLSGTRFSIFAFMGLIMLTGIVLANAILLVNYTNQLREQGKECDEALLIAGPVRLRPILMTAFATILALIPMALSRKEGAEMFNSLGITVIGGLLTSTLLTLIVVPVVYSVLDAIIRKLRHNRLKA